MNSDAQRPRKMLLRTKDAAQEIGVSERTLERWRSLGEGPPFIAIAGGIYYLREAVESWLVSRST